EEHRPLDLREVDLRAREPLEVVRLRARLPAEHDARHAAVARLGVIEAGVRVARLGGVAARRRADLPLGPERPARGVVLEVLAEEDARGGRAAADALGAGLARGARVAVVAPAPVVREGGDASAGRGVADAGVALVRQHRAVDGLADAAAGEARVHARARVHVVARAAVVRRRDGALAGRGVAEPDD